MSCLLSNKRKPKSKFEVKEIRRKLVNQARKFLLDNFRLASKLPKIKFYAILDKIFV